MRLSLTALALMLGFSGLGSELARGDETIELSKVPLPVRQAAEKAVPGIKLMEAAKGMEDGQVIYTVGGEDPKGRAAEVEATADGKIVAISLEIRLQDVPKVVLNALRTQLKGFQPTDVMAVYDANWKLIEYSFEGKDAKGKEIDVTVSADGSSVEIDDGDE
jgi:hypothetical protein